MARRNIIIVGVLAIAGLLVAAGTIAGVAAQTGGTPTATPAPGKGNPAAVDQFISKLASNLGISPDKLKAGLQQTATQMVDDAVAAGKLTPDQANQLKQRIAQGNFALPFGMGHGDKGPGHMGGPKGPRAAGGILSDAASVIGIDAATLRTELSGGKSLAQVAQAHGKSRDDLKAGLTAKESARLDTLVSSGKITADQKASMLSRFTSNLDKLIDRTAPQRESRGRPSPTPTTTG